MPRAFVRAISEGVLCFRNDDNRQLEEAKTVIVGDYLVTFSVIIISETPPLVVTHWFMNRNSLANLLVEANHPELASVFVTTCEQTMLSEFTYTTWYWCRLPGTKKRAEKQPGNVQKLKWRHETRTSISAFGFHSHCCFSTHVEKDNGNLSNLSRLGLYRGEKLANSPSVKPANNPTTAQRDDSNNGGDPS